MARLDDGFKTTITFAGAPTIKLYEVGVTPPGVEGGGGNDATTMRNTAWRTKTPKKLKTLTDGSFKAAYDVDVYQEIIARINQNDQITVTFPDTKTLVFWGWLDKFQPTELVEGGRPVADVTIIPSNLNASGVETAPVES